MPDLQIESHDKNRLISDSYRTQQWLNSPQSLQNNVNQLNNMNNANQ